MGGVCIAPLPLKDRADEDVLSVRRLYSFAINTLSVFPSLQMPKQEHGLFENASPNSFQYYQKTRLIIVAIVTNS